MVRVALWTVLSTTPWFMAAALPWGGGGGWWHWIDVAALGLSVLNCAAAATGLYYVAKVEVAMCASLITEAEVLTILAAKRRLDEL